MFINVCKRPNIVLVAIWVSCKYIGEVDNVLAQSIACRHYMVRMTGISSEDRRPGDPGHLYEQRKSDARVPSVTTCHKIAR